MNRQTILYYAYGHLYVARRHRGCRGLHVAGFAPIVGMKWQRAVLSQIDWE